jgi:hypothetical protein
MRGGLDHHPATGTGGGLVMRRTWLVAFGLLVAAPAVAADPPLGRLFFTPAQRAALEEARHKNIRAEEQAAQAASKPRAPRARDVTVNGLIKRDDGMSAIWVNGKPVEESETADGMRVSPTTSLESVLLRDPEKGRAVRLKVGQRANLLTGAVEEGYETRRAQAHAEEAARQMGTPSPVRKASERRARKRASPEDDEADAPAAKAAPAAATQPAEGVAEPSTAGMYPTDSGSAAASAAPPAMGETR